MGSERLAPEPRLDTGPRALCSCCRKSGSLERLHVVGGERLCPACAALAESRRCRAAGPAPPAGGAATGGASERIEERPERGRARLVADMRAWCVEVAWWPRVPVLALLGYWALRHLGDPRYAGWIDALNFGLHELGHVVFAPGGEFVGIAGGTLLQLSAPLVGAAMFVRQRDYFAIAFALGWLATNLYDVAVYVADARVQALPLVGLGSGEPIHDWGYLLGALGLLSADQVLATALRGLGATSFLLSLALGGWLLWQMAVARRAGPRA